jgi:DNA-binding transcriptional MerR regulator
VAEDAGKLHRLFEGMPILVVAAGPSLDELAPLLPQLARRMPIIAVDTSLRAVRGAGVEPDILTVVDPQYWNTRHLDRQALSSTLLVSESSTHPIIFRRPLGRLFFGGSIFPLGQFLETEHGARFKLGAGGSVATTAWDLARVLGAAEVYMAGLDLGFPDSRTHYSGSYFEERLHQLSDRLSPHETALFAYLRGGAPFKAPNNEGGSSLTDKRLVVYTKWFEEQLHFPEAPPTYNLSSRGIAIEGMPPCSAERLLAKPERREEIRSCMADLPEDPPELIEERRRELRERLDELIAHLEELGGLARRAETASARLLQLHGSDSAGHGRRERDEQGKLIAELERIDARLIESRGKEVAGFLLQGFLEALPDTEEVSQEQWLSIAERLYRQLAEAAEYHLRLFRSTAPA